MPVPIWQRSLSRGSLGWIYGRASAALLIRSPSCVRRDMTDVDVAMNDPIYTTSIAAQITTTD